MLKRCSLCGQKKSKRFLEERSKRKGRNVRAGLLKRQEAGLPIGRPKIWDQNKILALRKQGLSMRAIAKRLGCSTYTVQYAISKQSPDKTVAGEK